MSAQTDVASLSSCLAPGCYPGVLLTAVVGLVWLGLYGQLVAAGWQQPCPRRCQCFKTVVLCQSALYSRIPLEIPSSTTQLNLAGNNITSVNNELHSLSRLRHLDLSTNNIGRIDPRALNNLDRLEFLSLHNNKLTTLGPGILRGQTSLRELDLGENLLSDIEDTAFDTLTNLSRLDLYKNRLSDIPFRLLHSLSNLMALDLSDNNLTNVPTQSLHELGNLRQLFLDRNTIRVIHPHAFKSLLSVHYLQLSNLEELELIQSRAFAGLISLEEINLAGCKKLHVVEQGAFDNLPALKSIKLENSQLTTISESSIPWQNLQVLTLFGNPWSCDCRLRWLAELSRHRSLADVNEITCAAPDQHAGQSVVDIPPSKFVCLADTTENNNAGVVIGLVIICTLVTSFLIYLGTKIIIRKLQTSNLRQDEATVQYGSLY